MPSLADIMKVVIPVMSGVAGAVQPKTANALQSIVDMRQAYKDKDRRTRREDESDQMARNRESRQAEKYQLEMGEFTREREKRQETDDTIAGIMRSLPSRYTEDPTVMAMANKGDVAGIMEYVDSDIQGRSLSGNLIEMFARNKPQEVMDSNIKELVKAEPRSFLTGLQAIAPSLTKKPDKTLSMGDIAGIDIPPDAYISGKVDVDGVPVNVSRQGSGRTGSTAKMPEHRDPTVVTRRTGDYLTFVGSVMDDYNRALKMDVRGPRDKRDDPKKIKARADKIDSIRTKYLSGQAKYLSNTEKWPAEYRAPAVTWDELVSKGGLGWNMPTTEDAERQRSTSESDTAKKRSGIDDATNVEAKDDATTADTAFLRVVEQKMEAGEPLTSEEYQRYWSLKGGE